MENIEIRPYVTHIVFFINRYDTGGGVQDIIGRADTFNDAMEIVLTHRRLHTDDDRPEWLLWNWYQIYDVSTGKHKTYKSDTMELEIPME